MGERGNEIRTFVYDLNRDRRGRDRLIARSTTTCVIREYHQ
jgi:hypothetical protein